MSSDEATRAWIAIPTHVRPPPYHADLRRMPKVAPIVRSSHHPVQANTLWATPTSSQEESSVIAEHPLRRMGRFATTTLVVQDLGDLLNEAPGPKTEVLHQVTEEDDLGVVASVRIRF